ncbi:MAG: lysoplasmalogenase family protein [Clostridia bacterium]|nr:lysoplasmalogenase family protein [Clostridia bacterium]
MNLYKIIFSAIYIILLFFYFFSETSGNLLKRSVNKTALSTMFFSNFIFFTFEDGIQISPINVASFIAITFCFLADIILLFNFVKGAVAFSIGNIALSVYAFMTLAKYNISLSLVWWSAIIFVVVLGAYLIAIYLLRMNYKKYGIKMVIYLVTVTLNGSLGVAIFATCNDFNAKILGLGFVLFMLSDYLLVTYKIYRKEKWILRSNSGLYFIGMLLITMSFI